MAAERYGGNQSGKSAAWHEQYGIHLPELGVLNVRQGDALSPAVFAVQRNDSPVVASAERSPSAKGAQSTVDTASSSSAWQRRDIQADSVRSSSGADVKTDSTPKSTSAEYQVFMAERPVGTSSPSTKGSPDVNSSINASIQVKALRFVGVITEEDISKMPLTTQAKVSYFRNWRKDFAKRLNGGYQASVLDDENVALQQMRYELYHEIKTWQESKMVLESCQVEVPKIVHASCQTDAMETIHETCQETIRRLTLENDVREAQMACELLKREYDLKEANENIDHLTAVQESTQNIIRQREIQEARMASEIEEQKNELQEACQQLIDARDTVRKLQQESGTCKAQMASQRERIEQLTETMSKLRRESDIREAQLTSDLREQKVELNNAYDIIEHFKKQQQSKSTKMADKSCQGDLPKVADRWCQVGLVEKVDKSSQGECVTLKDSWCQGESVALKDTGCQGESVTLKDSSCQGESVTLKDSGCQGETITVKDSGCQGESVILEDSGCQSDSITFTDSACQGNYITFTDSACQGDSINVLEASCQVNFQEHTKSQPGSCYGGFIVWQFCYLFLIICQLFSIFRSWCTSLVGRFQDIGRKLHRLMPKNQVAVKTVQGIKGLRDVKEMQTSRISRVEENVSHLTRAVTDMQGVLQQLVSSVDMLVQNLTQYPQWEDQGEPKVSPRVRLSYPGEESDTDWGSVSYHSDWSISSGEETGKGSGPEGVRVSKASSTDGMNQVLTNGEGPDKDSLN